MAEERKLRLGIDASGAQQGAQEWARSTEQIRARSKLTNDSIRELEKSMGVTAQSFGRSGSQVSASARNALGSLFQYNQQIATSLKRTGESATQTGNAIFAALQRAGSSVISTGGNIRAGVGVLSGELLGAAGNAEGMAGALGLSAAAIGPITALGAAVAGLGYGLVAGAKNALALERSLTLIASRTDPAQFARYEDAAVQLSRTLGVDNVQAAQAFTSALISGFSTFEEQRSAATIGLKLFKTEGVDASVAISLLDNVLDSYGRTASQAAITTDQLLAGAKIGETTFQDMAQAVGIVGPVAAGLGVELEEVTGLLAGIAPKVGGATNAAQGFSNLLLQLSDRTSAVNQELRKNGIEVDANAIRTRGFDAVLADVAKGLEGRESLLAQVFGSPRIARVALSALQEVGAKSEDVLARIKSASEELNTSLAKVELLPTTRIDKAKASVSGFFTEIGQSLKQFASDVPALLENGLFDDQLPSKTEQAYKLLELQLKETLNIVPDGTAARYVRELSFAQQFASDSTKKANEDLKEQQRITAALMKDFEAGGIFSSQDKPTPQRPPNLPAAQSPLGPDFDQTISKAQDEITALSASLTVELGGALAKENAQLRATENEVRKKIEAFQKLGLDTSDLTAQLFALTNQNDELAKSFGYAGQAIGPDLDGKFQQLNKDAAALAATIDQELGTAFEQQVVSIRSSENALRTQIDALEASGVQTDELRQKLALLASQNDVTAASLGQKAFDEGIGKNLRDLEFQNSLIGETADEQARLTALREFDAAAMELQKQGFDNLAPSIMAAREQLEMLLADERLKRQAEELGHAIADPLTSGLGSVLTQTQSFGDALEDVYRQMIQNILKQTLLDPLNKGLVGLFGSLFGGGGGFGGGGSGGSGSGGGYPDLDWQGAVFSHGNRVNAFAKGGIPDGQVIPFAYGDIVSRATRFPMSRGRTGVMGERGTEAIMPVLARGPSGRLGVELVGKAPSSGGQPSVTNVDQSRSMAVTVNLNDPGDKRSRRQMLDDMSRMSRSA